MRTTAKCIMLLNVQFALLSNVDGESTVWMGYHEHSSINLILDHQQQLCESKIH